MQKTNITITDKQAQGFIAEEIAAGNFENADEVATDALRRVAVSREKRAEWEAMIAEGVAAANRGDMVDGEPYMQGRIAALKARK